MQYLLLVQTEDQGLIGAREEIPLAKAHNIRSWAIARNLRVSFHNPYVTKTPNNNEDTTVAASQ